MPQWGLFQTVLVREQEKALAWQRHIQEVAYGLVGGEGAAGVARPQYDPKPSHDTNTDPANTTVIRSRCRTDGGTCRSNGSLVRVIVGRSAHGGRAS
ncbi:hypothetical protein ACIBH3_34935, partial [Kitasatospora sp. NPDC050543]